MIVWFFCISLTISISIIRISSSVNVIEREEKEGSLSSSSLSSSNHRSLRKVEKVRINDLLWEIEVLYPTEKTTINKTYAVYDDKKILSSSNNNNPYDDYEYGRPYGKVYNNAEAKGRSEKMMTVQNDDDFDDEISVQADKLGSNGGKIQFLPPQLLLLFINFINFVVVFKIFLP